MIVAGFTVLVRETLQKFLYRNIPDAFVFVIFFGYSTDGMMIKIQ